jgi:hypothetical protein
MHARLMRRYGARPEVARDNVGLAGTTGNIACCDDPTRALFLQFDIGQQTLRYIPAGAVLLVLEVPMDTLLKSSLGRHLVLVMPRLFHGAIPTKANERSGT